VIFCKGGFVCVPVGLAAWILRIPMVIHDSDAHPGLANRILAKFAKKIATGSPLEFYNYPKAISQYVGIPVREEFKKYSSPEREALKQELGFSAKKPLVVVTGGGLGAARLNNATVAEAENLTQNAQIVLISGVGQFEELKNKTRGSSPDFHLFGFIAQDMWKYLAAADLVVARAGATSNLELAALAKPTILVPNARLTGGHQLKNAQVYEKSHAVEIVSDDEIEQNPSILSNKINELLSDEKQMTQLGEKFAQFAKPNAASDMAKIILTTKK
jgi:UDP-N-acetylglucosamine--N-acetylmuramyl-(pentapeptide) pyrophosphoryl-undecaprenol N-acetylglucosamine transferase